MTPNHEYKTPVQGTLDWHLPLNENFEAADTNLEVRDTEAALDQYTPEDGAKFLATDTGTRYLGDGSQWLELRTQPRREVIAPQVEADPTDANDGDLWYRADADELRVQTSAGPVTLTPPADDAGSSGDTPLVQNPLDTMDDIRDFFVEEQPSHAKVDAVSAPSAEGSGSMRINQAAYADNTFFGTAGYHYLPDRPEYPDEGFTECHLRYWVMLDENYDIDNPWAGTQAGKGFPGFDGRWGNDLSNEGGADGTNGWLVNGAIWSADEKGGDPNDWYLAYYVYYADQAGKYGDTFFPSKPMKKGRWYQIDRYVKLNTGKDSRDGILRQWQDGELVFDKTNFNFVWPDTKYYGVYAIRNLFYYGGGWGAPEGSGDNYAYLDDIQVYDSEQAP
jgi:hypothetical protein